ncbi:hypothetical protein ACODM8_13995 [Vibrio ostreicida]|uniref:hypothetical protein n=1 Tax=Vibrio ostreicida TaxID=526588 RepID=UPI003B5C3C8C
MASNHGAYEKNMQGILSTLQKNGVSLQKDYLTPDRFAVSELDLKGLEKITSHHQDTVFTDLYSKEETLMDKGRFLALAKEITDSVGQKTIDFEVEKVTAGKLKTEPLDAQDYAKGAPFFLSCKTKHCDFPGAVGGNYPVAEYLSTQGTSVKIFNDSNNYVGHYNLWKDNKGDFCIGTIAMIDNHGISQYSPKDLKNLILAQAISLLNNNEKANSVSIGMGGHNLKNTLPGKFEKNTEGFVALGQVRHADLKSVSESPLKRLEKITGYTVSMAGPVIVDQDQIGMAPEQRKDFKNALVVVNRENLEQKKKILHNYNETKNPRSFTSSSQDENSASKKLQRSEAFKSKDGQGRLTFVEALLKNNALAGCRLVSVNGMYALLRVDNPSNLRQTKQALEEVTKSAKGLQVENGFRKDELRIMIPTPELVSKKAVRTTNWTSEVGQHTRLRAIKNVISRNQISGCGTLSVNGTDVLIRVNPEQKKDVMEAFSQLAENKGMTVKESPKDNQVRVEVKI